MVATRYKTLSYGKPLLPGLTLPGDPPPLVFDFRPKPRTYKQVGVQVGRWFIPLGRWRSA